MSTFKCICLSYVYPHLTSLIKKYFLHDAGTHIAARRLKCFKDTGRIIPETDSRGQKTTGEFPRNIAKICIILQCCNYFTFLQTSQKAMKPSISKVIHSATPKIKTQRPSDYENSNCRINCTGMLHTRAKCSFTTLTPPVLVYLSLIPNGQVTEAILTKLQFLMHGIGDMWGFERKTVLENRTIWVLLFALYGRSN